MPNWRWLDSAKRYYNFDTHRFASRKDVLTWTGQSLDASGDKSARLSQLLTQGQVNLPDWQTTFRELIKREYIKQYTAGIGGLDQMTPRDWGSIGGMVAEQYRWLDDFAREIAAGNLTAGQIAARSRMYVTSANEAFERARFRSLADKNIDQERWVMDPPAEHCEDCQVLAAMGWQPLGTFPIPGQGETRCLTNCRCHKQYRNSTTGQVF